MTTNQTQNDKDFEDIKSKIPFDEEDTTEKPQPKDDESNKNDTSNKEEENVEDPEKDNKQEDDEEDNPQSKSRPLKYIPIEQYVSEKNKWQGDMNAKNRRIAELEKMDNLGEGSAKLDIAVKKYAEKYSLDLEQAREEVTRFNDIAGLFEDKTDKEVEKSSKEEQDNNPEDVLTEEQKNLIQEAEFLKAEKAFDKEYTSLAVPQIKSLFPKATDQQIQSAKIEIEKLATTEKYLRSDLDYIIYKEKNNLSDLFQSDRKGPESSRPGSSRGKQTYSSQDFNSGKAPFSSLEKLSASERDTIVKGFDTKTWDKYMHQLNSTEDLEIS